MHIILGPLSLPAFAQEEMAPTIVLLCPSELTASPEIREQIQIYEKEIEFTQEDKDRFVNPKLPPNWRFIREKEFAFNINQNFLSKLVLATEANLIYKIIDNHATPLIFPIKENASPDLISYKKIAENNKVSWVIDFLKVTLYKKDDKQYLKLQLNLYNVRVNRLFLNKEYVMESLAQVNDDTAAESWSSNIDNIVPLLVTDLLHHLERNRRYW